MNNTCKWKQSYIYPSHYEVSNVGEVRNQSGRILKPATDKDGYLYYVLCVNGSRKTVKAHRLVALTFIENPDDKPAIDHINGNKQDNRVENLRWVTNYENTNNPITKQKLDQVLSKRNKSDLMRNLNHGRKQTAVYKDDVLVGIFPSQRLAAESTSVSEGKVSQCLSGIKKSCKGYVFKEVVYEHTDDSC